MTTTQIATSKTASKLLDAARANDPERSAGCSHFTTSYGTIVVTWNRVEQSYDVGTMAKSYQKGRRRVVLPVLEELLAKTA